MDFWIIILLVVVVVVVIVFVMRKIKVNLLVMFKMFVYGVIVMKGEVVS